MQLTIGVDISKDHLDVCRWPDGATRRFANDRRGHRALLAWLGEAEVGRVVRVVYEPTGPYHRGLERALAAAGLPLAKVNPRQARRFAEATGRLAKTDRVDAAMLARMARCSSPSLGRRPARCWKSSGNSISRAAPWSRTAPPPAIARSSLACHCSSVRTRRG